MNSFKLKTRLDSLKSKREGIENKIAILDETHTIVTQVLQGKVDGAKLNMDKAKNDYEGKVKTQQLKVSELNTEIGETETRYRNQKEVESEGMGHSGDDENAE